MERSYVTAGGRERTESRRLSRKLPRLAGASERATLRQAQGRPERGRRTSTGRRWEWAPAQSKKRYHQARDASGEGIGSFARIAASRLLPSANAARTSLAFLRS